MRIHRGYLFWGIVFVLLGGIPLAERSGLIEADRLSDVGRLWPLLLIAIGVAIVVARTRLSLLGTVGAAVVIGGLAGSALAYGAGWALDITDCTGGKTGELQRSSQNGTFDGPADVQLQLNCGVLDLQAGRLTTALGGWSLDAWTRDAAPSVSATGTSLRIASPENTARRQEWTLFLPREDVRSISVEANAGAADLDVSGALLQSLSIQANAADTRVNATDADITSLSIQANAARSRITAGGDGAILIQANASSVDLCVPPSAALAITVKDGFALVTNLSDVPGLVQDGDTWQRTGTGGPSIVVQLDGNASTFTLDPEEGCA
jgi:hypothetical protein